MNWIADSARQKSMAEVYLSHPNFWKSAITSPRGLPRGNAGAKVGADQCTQHGRTSYLNKWQDHRHLSFNWKQWKGWILWKPSTHFQRAQLLINKIKGNKEKGTYRAVVCCIRVANSGSFIFLCWNIRNMGSRVQILLETIFQQHSYIQIRWDWSGLSALGNGLRGVRVLTTGYRHGCLGRRNRRLLGCNLLGRLSDILLGHIARNPKGKNKKK